MVVNIIYSPRLHINKNHLMIMWRQQNYNKSLNKSKIKGLPIQNGQVKTNDILFFNLLSDQQLKSQENQENTNRWYNTISTSMAESAHDEITCHKSMHRWKSYNVYMFISKWVLIWNAQDTFKVLIFPQTPSLLSIKF